MSEGTQSIDAEHAVVGEPASHPHQTVVVGEPPDDGAPVLGEPAFANGLQDQQPISPSSVDMTSANGFQSTPHTPFHEDSPLSSSHGSAPSSDPPVEETPHLHQVEAIEPGIGESVSSSHVGAPSSTPPVEESSNLQQAETIESGVGESDSTQVEVTHIVDSPSEVSPSLSEGEVPTNNPHATLNEGQTGENTSGRVLTGDDGVPVANASCTPEDISSKDQQEEVSLSSDFQETHAEEHVAVAQTDADDGSLEGSKAVNEGVHGVELEHKGEGDGIDQESNAKEASVVHEETGTSVVEQPVVPEVGQASVGDTFFEGNNVRRDIPAESEASYSENTPVESGPSSREVEFVMSRDVPQSEGFNTESTTPQKDILVESDALPNASEETPVQVSPVDLMGPQDSRALAAEDCLVSQPPPEETYSAPAANGSNGYQHCDNGEDALDKEQSLPKDDVDASAELEKPSSRSKLPLIFTGLAIAAVGVAVASISRPH